MQRKIWASSGTSNNSLISRLFHFFRRDGSYLPEIDYEDIHVSLYSIPGSKRRKLYRYLSKLGVDYALINEKFIQEFNGDEEDDSD